MSDSKPRLDMNDKLTDSRRRVITINCAKHILKNRAWHIAGAAATVYVRFLCTSCMSGLHIQLPILQPGQARFLCGDSVRK